MELSDEQISRIWDAHTVPVFGKTGINPIVFARAIESEVRKQDTELIRQMLEALEGVVTQVKYYEPVTAAITAARARMSPPPTA